MSYASSTPALAFAATIAAALPGAIPLPATAATEKVLYAFKTRASGEAIGRLLLLKGTLIGAGAGRTDEFGDHTPGRIFELKNLCGTTQFGGANDNDYGTVFELSRSGATWTETLLHVFDAHDGYEPLAGLRRDKAGNLYGSTGGGGQIGGGNVFELTPSNGVWSFNVLHSFGGLGDGADPAGAVIFDEDGNLYGTTVEGGGTVCKHGRGYGTVYEITP